MPDLSEQTTALIDWLTANGLPLAVAVVVLFVIYRWARPTIHRLLVGLSQRQAAGRV